MDLEQTKKTKVGRQWLSEYVKRIWLMLDRAERDTLMGRSVWRLNRGQRSRMTPALLEVGTGPSWSLTPLGREVAKHGRRERARLRSIKKDGARTHNLQLTPDHFAVCSCWPAHCHVEVVIATWRWLSTSG